MPDEPIDQTPSAANTEEAAAPPLSPSGENPSADQQAEAAPAQGGATPPGPIPYERFREVNERAKFAEQRTSLLEQRIAAMEAQRQPQAQALPSLDQVLQAYESGQCTEAIKDQWVAYWAKEDAKRELTQTMTHAAIHQQAQGVVNEYAKAYPSLNNLQSQEFQSVAQTYQQLVLRDQAWGLPNTPAREVERQAEALRMTFGPIRQVGQVATARRPDTYLEGGAGGGSRTTGEDPLKDVPDRLKQHWKAKGYNKERMIQEAKMRTVGNIDDYRRMNRRAS